MWFKYTVQKNIIQREPSLEPFIRQSSKDSYFYSKQILKRPWPEGEDIILTSPKYIHLYAKNVLKKRWKEGEERLAKDAEDWGHLKSGGRGFLKEIQDSVILYVKHLIKSR